MYGYLLGALADDSILHIGGPSAASVTEVMKDKRKVRQTASFRVGKIQYDTITVASTGSLHSSCHVRDRD